MPTESKRPLYERLAIPLVASRPGSWFYVHVAPYLDRALLRLTDGRWTTAGRGRVGFLKVRGARTGVQRVTPLVWTADGDRVLLVASRGGDVKHPAWYRNVVANPDVRFSADGVELSYRARDATGAERPRMWSTDGTPAMRSINDAPGRARSRSSCLSPMRARARAIPRRRRHKYNAISVTNLTECSFHLLRFFRGHKGRQPVQLHKAGSGGPSH